MASKAFMRWIDKNKQNVFTNGRGSVIVINFPIEFEHEVFTPESTGNLVESDVMYNGAIFPTALLPIRFSGNTKLTQEEKDDIRTRGLAGEAVNALAEAYDIHRVTVSRIIHGHTK